MMWMRVGWALVWIIVKLCKCIREPAISLMPVGMTFLQPVTFLKAWGPFENFLVIKYFLTISQLISKTTFDHFLRKKSKSNLYSYKDSSNLSNKFRIWLLMIGLEHTFTHFSKHFYSFLKMGYVWSVNKCSVIVSLRACFWLFAIVQLWLFDIYMKKFVAY